MTFQQPEVEMLRDLEAALAGAAGMQVKTSAEAKLASPTEGNNVGK